METEEDIIIKAAKQGGARFHLAHNKMWIILNGKHGFLWNAYFSSMLDAACAYLNLNKIMIIETNKKPGALVTGKLKAALLSEVRAGAMS